MDHSKLGYIATLPTFWWSVCRAVYCVWLKRYVREREREVAHTIFSTGFRLWIQVNLGMWIRGFVGLKHGRGRIIEFYWNRRSKERIQMALLVTQTWWHKFNWPREVLLSSFFLSVFSYFLLLPSVLAGGLALLPCNLCVGANLSAKTYNSLLKSALTKLSSKSLLKSWPLTLVCSHVITVKQ